MLHRCLRCCGSHSTPALARRRNRTGDCSVVAMSGNGKVNVVLGAQWGDEGKGKLVDTLAKDANIVARCQVSVALLQFNAALKHLIS